MVSLPFGSLYLRSYREENPTGKKNHKKMKSNAQLLATVFVVALLADYCSAVGLLSALYNPLLAGGRCGCGCGCSSLVPPPPPAPGLGLSLAHRFAYSKIPSLGLGCPSTCCMIHSKPCLLTKLLLLKKKLMEKKMMSGMGCCKSLCGCGCGCGCM